jgi:hypothetical protein
MGQGHNSACLSIILVISCRRATQLSYSPFRLAFSFYAYSVQAQYCLGRSLFRAEILFGAAEIEN